MIGQNYFMVQSISETPLAQLPIETTLTTVPYRLLPHAIQMVQPGNPLRHTAVLSTKSLISSY
jgi:hypothetical protein